MEKTVDDFIKDLLSLNPELRRLPIKVLSPFGHPFEPICIVLIDNNSSVIDEPKRMVITYE